VLASVLVASYVFLGIALIGMYATEAWNICLTAPDLYEGNFCPARPDALAEFSEAYLSINHFVLITVESEFGFKMPLVGLRGGSFDALVFLGVIFTSVLALFLLKCSLLTTGVLLYKGYLYFAAARASLFTHPPNHANPLIQQAVQEILRAHIPHFQRAFPS